MVVIHCEFWGQNQASERELVIAVSCYQRQAQKQNSRNLGVEDDTRHAVRISMRKLFMRAPVHHCEKQRDQDR